MSGVTRVRSHGQSTRRCLRDARGRGPYTLPRRLDKRSGHPFRAIMKNRGNADNDDDDDDDDDSDDDDSFLLSPSSQPRHPLPRARAAGFHFYRRVT